MTRREAIAAITTIGAAGRAVPAAMRANEWRRHFPALDDPNLVYLDTAATSLRPRQVIDAISNFYATTNANPGGSLHSLARRAHAAYDDARRTAAGFIGARDPLEIVFTRGTTEGINLVASAWGGENLRAGDEILIGIAEHASNMLPWQLIARKTGAVIRTFGIHDDGRPRLDELASALNPRTRVVAFSHVSNVLGMVNPAAEMCRMARGPGRIVVVDGAQSVPHLPVSVAELGCDFLAFSSHKMLGPMGVGVLWGRRELLDAMPPYQAGSNMAHDITLDERHDSEGALKFGAGTPNVSGPVGLAAAMRLIQDLGWPALQAHEQDITRHMLERLGRIRGLRILGSTEPRNRIAVFTFVIEEKNPRDVLNALDAQGIAIRAGDNAALPLLMRLGARTTARASCYLYTTPAEVDRFADALERV